MLIFGISFAAFVAMMGLIAVLFRELWKLRSELGEARRNNVLLAQYIHGITPDRNTQTEAEADETEAEILSITQCILTQKRH